MLARRPPEWQEVTCVTQHQRLGKGQRSGLIPAESGADWSVLSGPPTSFRYQSQHLNEFPALAQRTGFRMGHWKGVNTPRLTD